MVSMSFSRVHDREAAWAAGIGGKMQTATIEVKFRPCGLSWEYCSGMCSSCIKHTRLFSVRTLTDAEYERERQKAVGQILPIGAFQVVLSPRFPTGYNIEKGKARGEHGNL